MELNRKKCTSCEGNVKPLDYTDIHPLLLQLKSGWMVSNDIELSKKYKFKDFKQALHFTIKVGEIAEKEGHHPDILLKWGEVTLFLSTHSIKGLSENDFILAAKADDAFSSSSNLQACF